VLAPDERDELHETLTFQFGGGANTVLRWLESWKESSDPQKPEPQLLEQLYQTAFSLDTSIRSRPNGPRPPTRPFREGELETVCALYEITQGLLSEYHGGRPTVFRGVRRTTEATFFVQTLDEPSRDTYVLDADTALNVTTEKAPAVDFGSGLVFRFCLPRREFLLAIDQVRRGRRPFSDEHHIRGGQLTFAANDVIHTGIASDAWYPLPQLLSLGIDDGVTTQSVHDDIFGLVQSAVKCDIHPGTETGQRQLERWLEQLRSNSIYTQKRQRAVRKHVNEIKSPDPTNAYWTD